MPKRPIIDDEFSKLNGPLDPEEFAGLEADIAAEGCREPLKVWKGLNILLDGHTRIEICSRLKKPYKVEYIDLPDRPTAALWIMDLQGHRRNLTTVQKAARASKRKVYLAAQAEERRLANLKKGREKPDTQLVGFREAGEANDLAAKPEKISGETLRQYEKVKAKGTSEAVAAMEAGEKGISATYHDPDTFDEPPPDPKRKPKAPAEPKDATGKVLPKHLLPIFARVEEITAVQSKISALKGEVLKLAATPNDPIWGKFNVSQFAAEMDNARNLLKAIKPYATCPYCVGGERGSGKHCRACEGSGWLSFFHWKMAPAQMREDAKE